MKVKTRKLIGTFGVLVGLFAYIVLCVNIADLLPGNALIELLFYAFAGVAWAFPTTYLIRWMNRSDTNSD